MDHIHIPITLIHLCMFLNNNNPDSCFFGVTVIGLCSALLISVGNSVSVGKKINAFGYVCTTYHDFGDVSGLQCWDKFNML